MSNLVKLVTAISAYYQYVLCAKQPYIKILFLSEKMGKIGRHENQK